MYAKTAEEVVYVNMVGSEVDAKNVKIAHITYVHVIVWSVHQLTLLQLEKTSHQMVHMEVI